MVLSCGSWRWISRSTVMPPTSESNTPIGRLSANVYAPRLRQRERPGDGHLTMLAGFPFEERDAVRQHRQDDLHALGAAFRAAGQVHDHRPVANAGEGPRQH